MPELSYKYIRFEGRHFELFRMYRGRPTLDNVDGSSNELGLPKNIGIAVGISTLSHARAEL